MTWKNEMLNSKYQLPDSSEDGFTIVELLVVVAILGALAVLSLGIVNPVLQIQKARDTTKVADLNNIKTALDLYYDDNHCYPHNGTLSFGSEWTSEKGTIYMKEIPQSPDTTTPYSYIADNSSICPQWNVLFSRFSVDDPQGIQKNQICPLHQKPNCSPANSNSNTMCVISGNIDETACAQLTTQSIN